MSNEFSGQEELWFVDDGDVHDIKTMYVGTQQNIDCFEELGIDVTVYEGSRVNEADRQYEDGERFFIPCVGAPLEVELCVLREVFI